MKYFILLAALLIQIIALCTLYNSGIEKGNRAHQKHINKMNLLLTQYESQIAHCNGYLLKFTHSK